tara:strand:- start:2154 stop:4031 length:1878 start_codon:yes stop_codon:yes gene_type:complete
MKSEVKHLGRMYKVRKGKRGGYYIMVKGEKKYLKKSTGSKKSTGPKKSGKKKTGPKKKKGSKKKKSSSMIRMPRMSNFKLFGGAPGEQVAKLIEQLCDTGYNTLFRKEYPEPVMNLIAKVKAIYTSVALSDLQAYTIAMNKFESGTDPTLFYGCVPGSAENEAGTPRPAAVSRFGHPFGGAGTFGNRGSLRYFQAIANSNLISQFGLQQMGCNYALPGPGTAHLTIFESPDEPWEDIPTWGKRAEDVAAGIAKPAAADVNDPGGVKYPPDFPKTKPENPWYNNDKTRFRYTVVHPDNERIKIHMDGSFVSNRDTYGACISGPTANLGGTTQNLLFVDMQYTEDDGMTHVFIPNLSCIPNIELKLRVLGEIGHILEQMKESARLLAYRRWFSEFIPEGEQRPGEHDMSGWQYTAAKNFSESGKYHEQFVQLEEIFKNGTFITCQLITDERPLNTVPVTHFQFHMYPPTEELGIRFFTLWRANKTQMFKLPADFPVWHQKIMMRKQDKVTKYKRGKSGNVRKLTTIVGQPLPASLTLSQMDESIRNEVGEEINEEYDLSSDVIMRNNTTYDSVVLGYDFSNAEDCYKIFVNNIEKGYARLDKGRGHPYEDTGYGGKFFLIKSTSDVG